VKKVFITGLVFGIAGLAFSACATRHSAVSGQVTYLVRSALPADAVVTIQIQDTSPADAPTETVGEQIIQAGGNQVPFDFSVAYDPAKIIQIHRYSLSARIQDAQGRLLFINTENIPVITNGAPSSGIQAILEPVGPAAPAGSTPLTAAPWLLTALANFSSGGHLTGSASCNSYTTPYQLTGNSLSFGQTITTLKACDAPIMQQESEYLQALEATIGYGIHDGTLTLTGADGKPLAIFATQSLDLTGTNWLVSGYNDGHQAVVSVLAGTVLDATFGTDGNIGGSAGCNNYFAPYSLNGTSIAIGPASSTRKMCAQPEGIMDQESHYLAALQTAATFELSGSELTLRTKEGAMAATLARAP